MQSKVEIEEKEELEVSKKATPLAFITLYEIPLHTTLLIIMQDPKLKTL